MSKYFLPIAIGVLFLITSCSTTKQLATMAPEKNDATSVAYDAKTSFLPLPIQIPYTELSKQLNVNLPREMYKDTVVEDDDLKVLLEKTGDLQLSFLDGKILTTLPLKATIQYRYGTDRLGVKLFDTKTFVLNGVVELHSEVHLTNWKLSTKTKLEKINWVESPTMSMLGKPIPVTYLMNPAIKIFRGKIEKSIDDAIAKNVDFKPQVLQAMQQISEPFAMSDAYEAWLQVIPLELYTTQAVLEPKEIVIEMGLKCMMETTLGKKPTKKWQATSLVLKPVMSMPDQFQANVVAVSNYAEASRIVTKNFKGYTFEDSNRKVVVQEVQLWHQSGKMVIALTVQGSINGKIYLKGIPKYDAHTKEVFFEEMDYVLDTKNVLMKTANWLLSGMILKKIQKQCKYSIAPNLQEAEKQIKLYFNGYEPTKGVKVYGTLKSLDLDQFQLMQQGFVVFLKATGKVQVKISGM